MKDGYVNEGQEPFVLPEQVVNNSGKTLKKAAREANKKHYGLKGLTIKTSSPCPHCKRKSCNTRDECRKKAEEKTAARATTIWYFR